MIDEIVKSTREASAVLDRIKSMPCEGLEKEVILPLLRKAVNLKLMIQEDTQTDIPVPPRRKPPSSPRSTA